MLVYNNVVGLATVTTVNAHGLKVDNVVEFVGADQALYNNSFVVSENVGLSTFVVNIGVNASSPATTGTIFAYRDGYASNGGLITVDDFGGVKGIQMQGLDSQYTLILIDNQPIVGRSAGTLDLDRISVGNIQQIEIVRGASSSLYGNEALAGVINIITRKALDQAVLAHKTLGCRGVTRSDFRYDDTQGKLGELYFLEINTQPGMTSTSLIPEQASHALTLIHIRRCRRAI